MNEVELIEKFCKLGSETYLSQLSDKTLLFFYLVARKSTDAKINGLNTKRANDVIAYYYSKKIDEKSVPNLKGKSFEFAICREIRDRFEIPVANKSIPRFFQYSLKYDLLSIKDQQDLRISADHIVDWIQDTFDSNTFREVLLLPDHYGAKGVVADIVIRTDKKAPTVAISAKNNKLYAKSPRPLSILDHKFLPDNIVQKWKSEYKKLIYSFYDHYHHHGNSFKSIPNAEYVKKINLYDPINKLLMKYLNKWFYTSESVEAMFLFLAGIDKNYVVVNNKKKILIYDHTIPHEKPTSFKVSMNTKGYIFLQFDNGFIISMRLHTASSKFQREVSLKYDVCIDNVEELYPVIVLDK